jgi:hypothetical protein
MGAAPGKGVAGTSPAGAAPGSEVASVPVGGPLVLGVGGPLGLGVLGGLGVDARDLLEVGLIVGTVLGMTPAGVTSSCVLSASRPPGAGSAPPGGFPRLGAVIPLLARHWLHSKSSTKTSRTRMSTHIPAITKVSAKSISALTLYVSAFGC